MSVRELSCPGGNQGSGDFSDLVIQENERAAATHDGGEGFVHLGRNSCLDQLAHFCHGAFGRDGLAVRPNGREGIIDLGRPDQTRAPWD
jgi:hypothetical protein